MNTTNLFEKISSLTFAFPINPQAGYIESYFKVNYNLKYLKDEELKSCITILFKKHKNYKELTNAAKIKLIKNEYMRNEFISGKFNHLFLLDLVLLKEIQAEKEKNKNEANFQKTAFSPHTGKTMKKKFSFISADKNLKNKNEKIKLKNDITKQINNYHPENFNIKKTFYNNIKGNTKKEFEGIFHTTKLIAKLCDKLLIWIDANYNNPENTSYLKLLQKNKDLIYICFHDVSVAFNYLFSKKENKINKFKFREIFILISGRLYPDYYQQLKENINKINFLPICCIFTSYKLEKEIKIKTTSYKEIGNQFYNKHGVKTNFIECIESFGKYTSFYNSKINKILNKNININRSYEGCLTFEQIYSKNQIVLPFLFHEIMENKSLIPNSEIINFESFIINNFKQEKIQKIIMPMLYVKDFPREIVSKFFTRLYTEQTLFFSEMNKSLMRKEKNYDTFTKVMYEGLYIGSLQQSKDEILYRGTKMKKDEIENIRKLFDEWKKTTDEKLPKFFLYSRTFLSFTKLKEKIKSFIGKTDEFFYGIIFLLKNNKNIAKNYSSNADIECLSKYPDEKEVLFFPYTTFCLKNIYEQKYENQNCIFIELDYLGQYEYIFDQFKSDEQFQKEFINSLHFSGNNYSDEVINSNLFFSNENNLNDYNENEEKKEAKNNFISKIIPKIQKLNKDFITINFLIENEEKYSIKCFPDIPFKDLITYFYGSLNCKLTLNQFKGIIPFIYNDQIVNHYYCSSKKINEIGINDGVNIIVINFHNFIKTGFDNKNSEFISESQRENLFTDINNNILINEIIDDLKDLRKPLPKKIIQFRFNNGTHHIRVNNEVTIDQLLRIYLRRVFRKELINDEHNNICFLFNAAKLEFGDNTPIEIYFKTSGIPKVIVVDINNLIGGGKAELFEELIRKLESFLYPKSKPKIISDEMSKEGKIITIKFNKKGKIIDINMQNDNMVAELLNEYFIKTNTEKGNFIFNGKTLSPSDTTTLFESGLKNNSEIIVS